MDIEHDMARILIGPGQEEWYFPIEILPEGSGVGTELLFSSDNGRYSVLGLSRTAEKGVGRSIEDRLSRPLSLRKTADLKMSDLQAELDEL